jgi:hypothetical protein
MSDETETETGAGAKPVPETPKTDGQGRDLLTLKDGRVLTLRPAGDMLTMMDVLEAAGVDARGQQTERVLHNPTWIGNANVASQVAAFDGVPYPLPRNLSELRALIGKVGRQGMNALSQRWAETARDANEEAAKN